MLRGARNPKIFGSSYQPPIEKKPRSINRAWRALVTVIFVAVVVILIGRLPIFQIKTVELLGDNDNQISSELDKLHGQLLFSRSVGGFVEQIQQQTAVEQFSCRKGIPSSLRCTLELRQRALIWQSGDSQYEVDKNGIIFAAMTAGSQGGLVVEDTLQQPITLGKTIVSPEIVSIYQQLVAALASKQISVNRFQIEETLYQVGAIIDRPGKSSVKALFLLTDSLQNQVESVSTVLAQRGDSITERIDARVSGYVYTK